MNVASLGMGPILADAARALARHAPEEAEELLGGLERSFRARTPFARSATIEAALREHFPERAAATIRALRRRGALEPLLALERTYRQTERRRSNVEARPALTDAYVSLVFACGFARIGQPKRAEWLRSEAAPHLDRTDPIHGFLARAFEARNNDALRDAPPDTPLSAALTAERHALERFPRYKADRMLQASTLLEPTEELDPAADFERREGRPLPLPPNFIRRPFLAPHQSLRSAMDSLPAIPHLESTQLVAKMSARLPEVTDSYNTNSHFCLTVVEFMELLVQGLTGQPTLRPSQDHDRRCAALREQGQGVAGESVSRC